MEVDRFGSLPRWPAAAPDPPDDTPPLHSWHWRRGLAAVAAYALAGVTDIAFMSPNTSWEHHPFAGPLVALNESRNPAEFVFSFAIWSGLGAGLCWPAFRASVLAVAVSLASAAAWVALSVWAAGVASC